MRPSSPRILSLPVWPSITEKEILRKYNLSRLIKMASNENCYGPSPAVDEALRQIQAHRYPDLHAGRLKEAIARKFGVLLSQILVGNGSSEIIQMIAQTYLASGQQGLTALETFPVYFRAAAVMDATCVRVPLKADAYDLPAMLASVNSSTRIIFVANPNNPTGACADKSELRKFISSVPSNVLVVLDEAYKEYEDEPEDTVAWLSEHPNLLLLRTFSKVHGLAGLRIGYAIASVEIINDLDRVRLPYTVSVPAQVAALAALQDDDHVRRCASMNREQRISLQQEFARRGYEFVPSQANFILLKRDIAEDLLKKGILVAALGLFQMPNAVRITLGTREENAELLKAL